jgi:hypothetical protein
MSLEFLIRVLLAVSVILATALLMSVIFARGSAALRHRLWSLSVAAVLMIPLLVPLLPQWKLGWVSGPESQPTVSLKPVVPDSPVANATPATPVPATYRRHGPSAAPGNSRTAVRVHSGGLSQLFRSRSSSFAAAAIAFRCSSVTRMCACTHQRV